RGGGRSAHRDDRDLAQHAPWVGRRDALHPLLAAAHDRGDARPAGRPRRCGARAEHAQGVRAVSGHPHERRTTDVRGDRRADPWDTVPVHQPHHVIIAGGGFAAVEAVLALRALAQERVTLELVAADELLRYRPSATGQPFGADEVAGFPLAELAANASATFRCDALSAVLPARRMVRLASGATRR